jgi:hypothetical protein
MKETMQRSRLHIVLPLATLIGLTGCVFNIKKPSANQVVVPPVNAEIDWGESFQSFKVVLDPNSPW